MSVEDKVPEIRFKGFSGEWEMKILDKVVKLENGFAFKSKYFMVEPTDVIVLTPGSVNIGGGFQDGKGQYYDIKQDISDKYVFEPGDMFVTMTDLTPTAQALGFPAIVPRDDKTYLHNQRLGKLMGFEGNSEFLFYWLCTPKKQREVVLTSSGTTVKHTSPSKFLNRYSCLPEKKEQTKIGNYFQQIDTLISQHQQKHDKLLNLKKSLLEKLFPKQGATEPEIRFKGFSGEWEEKQLDNLCTVITKGTTPLDKSGKGNVNFIKIENINSLSGKITVTSKIKDEEHNDYLKRSQLYENDILFSIAGTLGRIAIIEKGLLPANTNQALAIIRLKMGDISYVTTYLKGKAVSDYVKRNPTVGAQPNLSLEQIGKIELTLPERNEQTKIGNLFNQLDTLINQHQAQLKKLNNIKQACLEKMFV